MPKFKSMSDIEVLIWFKNFFVERKNYYIASEIRELEKKIRELKVKKHAHWCSIFKPNGKNECDCYLSRLKG